MPRRLPETQVALLEAASATDEKTIDTVAEAIGEKPETLTRAAFELADDGLLTVTERTAEDLSLTDEGETYLEAGLPEHRLHTAALEAGADTEPVPLGQVIGASGLNGPEVDIALSNLARKALGEIDSGELHVTSAPNDDLEASALEAIANDSVDLGYLDEGVVDRLASRDLLTRRETTVRSITLTDDGVNLLMEGLETAETVGQVTTDLLTSGAWRDVEFAEYNVEADAETTNGGRKHVLRQTADRVKDVLIGMGFSEMEGPHADAEFWINDCLFMPQDHPARTHWDQFALDLPPMRNLPDELMTRVEGAHSTGVGEDGDGYHSPWTEDVTRGVDLRGHTTSLSMRYLSGHEIGELQPPQRYFSVEKVYRNDTLDPTHLLEFFQIEGWVMAENLSVRDLMGTFTEFYEQFGITEIEFKPHYNPYTEPSFELFGTHPKTGDIVEIGNSGIFREEVLQPLGVTCDVMAWGLALERLLMLMYGFEDIRDVHGTLCDLGLLRNTEAVY
jgi:phenylalanyl-tRNA synthetase alpha chain